MRKKIAILLGVSLFLLVFAATALANSAEAKLRPRSLHGEVVSLDSSASTVDFLCRNGSTKTLHVVGATKILKNGHRVGFSRLGLGDRGMATYVTTGDSTLEARKIIVKTRLARGKISEITTDTITLKRPKSSRVFLIMGSTKIRRNGALVALSDLKVGDQAKVAYNKTEEGDLVARSVKAAGHKH